MTEYLAPYVNLDSVGDQTSSIPVICNRIPEPNETGVSSSNSIQFDLWNPTGIGFKLDTLQVTANTLPAIVDGVIQAPFSGSISGTYQDSWVRVILSGVSWESLSNVNIDIEIDTWDGFSISDSYLYVIADETAPEVYSATATHRSTIRIVYAQSVIDPDATSVIATFPWGGESLAYDSSLSSWVLSPLAYPYLRSTITEPYTLAEGTILGLIINGAEHLIAIPALSGTTAVAVASDLNSVLASIGASAIAYNNRLYIRNADPTGTIEVINRGAQAILKLESGIQYARLPFGTPEGTYSISTKATFASGVVEFQTVSLELLNSIETLRLIDFGLVMGDSALVAGNYVITIDPFIVAYEIRPTWIPTVESVTKISDNTYDLVLDTDMTPQGPYILTVFNVYDASGNLVSSDHDSVTYRGFSPQTPTRRQFDLFRMQPLYNRQEDQSYGSTLLKFMRVLQEVEDQLLADMDEYTGIFNLDNAPDWFIEAFLSSHGSPFDFMPIDVTKKRQLSAILVDLLRIRATNPGIEAALKFFFGFTTVSITSAWGLGWLLGDSIRSILGTSTVLNSSDRRDKFTIIVEVDRDLTEDELWQVKRVIEVMKPDHIHYDLRQPEAPFVPNHWQLGYSVLGTNTIVH